MDKEDRYIPFNLQMRGQQLEFHDPKNKELQVHQLFQTYAHSPDSPDERVVDKSGKFPGVKLSFGDGSYRRVYFFNHDLMKKTVDRLIELQGFTDRADQYERVRELPDGIMCQRWVVRHKLTGTQYEMRCVDTNEVDSLGQSVFEYERQARQKSNSLPKVD